MKYKLLLTLILAFALFINLYKLNALPSDFHEDEVLSGYIGRYIIQNGRDTYGNKWPLFYFNKFGDYYIIFPIYLAGLSTYIFGINEFAIRFPAALFGALAIIPIYILAYWIFKNKKIALVAALFTALAPWQWVLARSTTEGIIGSCIFLYGIVLLIYSLQHKVILPLLASAVLFLVGYDIYHPFRIYPPIVLLVFIFLFREVWKNRKYLITYILITLFFFSLSYYISTTVWGRGRFMETSIFSPGSGVSLTIKKFISDEGPNNILIARIFHNKVVGYGREFINQYTTYFSTTFLFISGWEKTRYNIPEQGLLYFTFLGFLFLTVLPIKTKSATIDKRLFIVLLFLLFLAPAPAALTAVESPNVHRALFIIYPLIILSAYGFYKSQFVRYKSIRLSYVLLFFLCLEVIYFWHQYSHHMDLDLYTSLSRNDGQKQVALYAGAETKNYDQIILPAQGAMSWYYLFYNKDFSPSYIGKFRLDARIDYTGKIRYIENSCPSTIVKPADLKGKVLIIDRFDCESNHSFKQTATIRGVNPLLNYKVLAP